MDGDLLRSIYHGLRDLGMMHTQGCTYSDGLIIIVEMVRQSLHLSAREALTHPRLPLWIRRLGLPGVSQFNRRIKTPGVQQGLSRFNQSVRAKLARGGEKICDGKPLIVGGFSKDPDARTGHAPGGWAKGYKLHVIADDGGAVETWRVTPLNTGEAGVAREMIDAIDLRGTLLRGDGNYDSVALYEKVCDAGGRLLAPRRKPGRGLGHHRQHPHRLEAIATLESDAAGLAGHKRRRNRVEQIFGRLTTLSFGLWALPPHVRRLDRVQRWANAKIALYHAYLALKQQSQAGA
jgi:hypothetical protein